MWQQEARKRFCYARIMDLKELKSSQRLILSLGDFSTEVMELLHREGANLTEADIRTLKEALAEIHQLMARIGYTTS